ncbi:hypothetical protein Tco_0936204 [Tanacetum coccineum]
MMTTMMMMLRRMRRRRRRRSIQLWQTLLLYLQMTLSPQAKDAEAITTDEYYRVAATLPLSSPPPENVESLKDNIRETMTTVDQGMSVEEIERVVAQRVANAIEAIAIYETKTNMARKSISQTEQQECKVADSPKRTP